MALDILLLGAALKAAKEGGGGGGKQKSELKFASRSLFPQIGETDILYIATDENAIYRFDVSTSEYVLLTEGIDGDDTIDGGDSDIEDIDIIIDGGNSYGEQNN